MRHYQLMKQNWCVELGAGTVAARGLTMVGIGRWNWNVHRCTGSGQYVYREFNTQQLYVLPTQCIYVFCVDLRTNSHYFPIQH